MLSQIIYPVFMQLLRYGQGITIIIPSDISPDMFGTRSCSVFLKFVQACHIKNKCRLLYFTVARLQSQR